MKRNKLLSIFLVVIMVFSLISVNVHAAGKTYTASESFVVTSTYSLNKDNFKIKASVNNNKIYVLDGYTSDYTYEILHFNATYTDLDGVTHTANYNTAPEDFFAIFDKKTADMEQAKIFNEGKPPEAQKKVNDITLETNINITFADNGIFGVLEYEILIEGFSAPAVSTGDLGIGDALDAVKLPTDIKLTGSIDGFPTIDDVEIDSKPVKTSYTDAEKFDATGLELKITTTDGISGIFKYTETTAFSFNFNPTNKEKLSVYDSEVITYLNGVEILKTPITVEHKWSTGPVNITTDKYSENKPGYHAVVCEGCGKTHNAQPHTPSPVLDENGNPKVDENGNVIFWTPNNDQTFVQNGTESSICSDCGTVLTRDTFGTAGFNTTFGDMHFIKVIFEYINVLLRFIGAATY